MPPGDGRLDALSEDRPVIVFDNQGVGHSTGTVPHTVVGMARDALDFTRARGLERFDLLGWSMGGFVAQEMALRRPGLVRRLVVAGSGPGGVPGAPTASAEVWQVALKPVNEDEDFLYLFFPQTPAARSAGLESLRRLDTRLHASGAAVSPAGVHAQREAITAWAAGHDSAWPRLHELTLPVLAANGAHYVMIDAYHTFAMRQRLLNAVIIIYSDAGHAFLFQHAHSFARQVLDFLNGPAQ
jgi:pimeloyl-ACP methyl ester carboxylesterase